MPRPAKYDYAAIFDFYCFGGDPHGKPITIMQAAKHGNIEYNLLLKHSKRHDWEKARQTRWTREGRFGPQAAPPPEPEPEPEAPAKPNAIAVGNGVICPWCHKPHTVPPQSIAAYVAGIEELRDNIEREIQKLKDSSGVVNRAGQLKQLVDSTQKIGQMYERAQQMEAQAKITQGGQVLLGDDVDELVRLGDIFIRLLSMAPADDPRIMELGERYEETKGTV